MDRLYSLVLDGPTDEHGMARLGSLYDGAERLAKEHELGPVLKFLEARLRQTVAEMAPRRVFVHAGVVAHRGRAIVIPGPSMSGKSTLVAELIKCGATYYSDEYAVVDDKGMVYPFAKPISLRAPGSFEGIDCAAEQFGAAIGAKSVPIGLVLVTRYAAEAKWHPRKLTPAQGALALLAHSIAARNRPRRVMATLSQALEKALVLKGARGDASGLAQQLLEVLDGSAD
jgi:serine kinase of HPr protein (carbohydrate metabolism regulator)